MREEGEDDIIACDEFNDDEEEQSGNNFVTSDDESLYGLHDEDDEILDGVGSDEVW